jgi:hypothetical protein
MPFDAPLRDPGSRDRVPVVWGGVRIVWPWSLAILLAFLTVSAPLQAAPDGFGAAVEEPVRWGVRGHEMAARAAVETLPREMPAFFRAAGDALVWLNPEPDRWREREFREMDERWRYDHYVDLENIPPGVLEASRDRWEFFENLLEAGVDNPKVTVGFSHFTILELYQRIVNSFARWRTTEDTYVRRLLEARIVDDAGILGHFVTDASQPHHTTIHFNGWDEGRVPNPGGYTTDSDFHARFESWFVAAHVSYEDVRSRVTVPPRSLADDVRDAVVTYIQASNHQVEELYRIDRDHGFHPDQPADPVSLAFAAERIAVGAEMLRDLWWTAWVASEAVAAGRSGGS